MRKNLREILKQLTTGCGKPGAARKPPNQNEGISTEVEKRLEKFRAALIPIRLILTAGHHADAARRPKHPMPNHDPVNRPKLKVNFRSEPNPMQRKIRHRDLAIMPNHPGLRRNPRRRRVIQSRTATTIFLLGHPSGSLRALSGFFAHNPNHRQAKHRTLAPNTLENQYGSAGIGEIYFSPVIGTLA
jgi:hypothetical protein